MKRKWNLWNIICFTGIPWFFIGLGSGLYIKSWYYSSYKRRVFQIRQYDDIKDILLMACILWIIVILFNSLHLNSDKSFGLFTWLEKYRYEPSAESWRKRKAQHPPVDEKYLSDVPDGLVLGKSGKKYVRFPIKEGNALSTIILGTPGSGKSTLILTSLIYQQHRKLKKGDEKSVYFILDCKPELLRKSSMPGAKTIKELSIQDRSKFGWDVYYRLTNCSCDDEVLSELDVIARALIDGGKDNKNEFFYESARAIFKFMCLADYKKGKSFMQTIDHILDSNLEQMVKQTIENAEGKSELIKVKKGLNAYVGKDGEAFQGIELAFRQSLEVFQKDATKFFLDGNPKKLSPMTLEDKISIAFTIKTTKIQEFKTILRVVVMQLIHHCEDRDEDGSHLITLIIDEAYRLGLINWIDFLSVCRSKQVSCVLAFQSLSQMQSVWSKEDATSLTEMVSAIAILSCSDPQTQKMICDWVGEYQEEKISTNVGGKNDGTFSRSFETKKILQPTDLMQIKNKKEVVLFLDGSYYRVNVEKAKYYMIPEILKYSERCVSAHKKYENRRKE
ncbi:MAG: type IV secretory system conjugative DNA transfer family protein [Lachnospiraceae bacterium]|nr:type IV secretory system conjugative DNA transfer family protein [Lachnospiraceae bacterium]